MLYDFILKQKNEENEEDSNLNEEESVPVNEKIEFPFSPFVFNEKASHTDITVSYEYFKRKLDIQVQKKKKILIYFFNFFNFF